MLQRLTNEKKRQLGEKASSESLDATEHEAMLLKCSEGRL